MSIKNPYITSYFIEMVMCAICVAISNIFAVNMWMILTLTTTYRILQRSDANTPIQSFVVLQCYANSNLKNTSHRFRDSRIWDCELLYIPIFWHSDRTSRSWGTMSPITSLDGNFCYRQFREKKWQMNLKAFSSGLLASHADRQTGTHKYDSN